MKILIADDEELVRFSVQNILEEIFSDPEILRELEPAGAAPEIRQAATGSQLEILAREFLPDFAFVDIRMPGFSGLDAIEKLQPDCPGTQWVILSGYSKFEYARRALSLGVLDYLVKPVDPRELRQVLKKGAAVLRQFRREEDARAFLGTPGGETAAGPEAEPPSPLIRNALNYGRNNFDQPMGVAQAADYLGVTPNYLSSRFHKSQGITFTKYITDLRMAKARELLSLPNRTVKDTALALGYQSSRHFARVFREYYNCSPTEFLQKPGG